MLYEIYLITNTVNNKKYIGQTASIKGYEKRFQEHCKNSLIISNNCLYKAMRKYGISNFTVKRLLKNISENEIDFYESLWINKFNTYYGNHCGYNMTFGGRGTNGYIFTDEVREKISDGVKEYWKNLSDEEYNRLCTLRSQNMKGKSKSIEHKRKLSELAKQRTGKKNSFYGHQHSEETKYIISKSNSKMIGMFSLNGDFIMSFTSIKDAVKYLLDNNITNNKSADSRISKICRGIDKSAYGFIWKFL